MRIVFRKLNDREHTLDVGEGPVTFETRSFMRHDLLHYALEAEAELSGGFWGSVARGRRRLGELGAAEGEGPELMAIERLVGALDGAAKGQAAKAAIAAVRRYDETTGGETPPWLTEALVLRVQERLRRLLGQWNATPRMGSMELTWPPPSA